MKWDTEMVKNIKRINLIDNSYEVMINFIMLLASSCEVVNPTVLKRGKYSPVLESDFDYSAWPNLIHNDSLPTAHNN